MDRQFLILLVFCLYLHQERNNLQETIAVLKMLTKICRGTSVLRCVGILESSKYLQKPLNYAQRSCHYRANSFRLGVHMQCCISQYSTALYPKQSQITCWILKRFRTHSTQAQKDLSGIHENITALHTKPRTQRWRSNTQNRTEKGVRS